MCGIHIALMRALGYTQRDGRMSLPCPGGAAAVQRNLTAGPGVFALSSTIGTMAAERGVAAACSAAWTASDGVDRSSGRERGRSRSVRCRRDSGRSQAFVGFASPRDRYAARRPTSLPAAAKRPRRSCMQ
ncbi:hypothetical protein M433DRAFT_321139 [Acidomyces richmondensis BFW]|nr:MAG: hypothetical protein FE78DRAFT_381313 [Acidomyces sp. 'richmondensis']KYG44067.1 hypothetical protein M433DRAFT_321139 [Acidomyces richmondensis BFW]